MGRHFRAAALCALGLAASGCGDLDFPAAEVGRFEGSLIVLWVGPNETALGDGTFIFIPGREPLKFTRPGGKTIEPTAFYTDGGSIPKVAQSLRGFSAWTCAPAYIIHDYLFAVRHCLKETDRPTVAERQIHDLAFHDTAVIMAEALKTLVAEGRVPENDFAQGTISQVVAGPITERMWDPAAGCNRIRAAQMAAVVREATWLEDVGATATHEAPDLRLRSVQKVIRLGEVSF